MNVEKLREILESAKGEWGVVVKPVGELPMFEYRADEVFRAANVNKLPVALYCLHLVEAGAAALDQLMAVGQKYYQPGSGILQYLTHGTALPLRDLVALMLVESDNTAAEVLVRTYGAIAVNNYLASPEFQTTRLGIRDRDYDFGETSPREMAALLEGIFGARYVNREHSDMLLTLRKRVKTNSASNDFCRTAAEMARSLRWPTRVVRATRCATTSALCSPNSPTSSRCFRNIFRPRIIGRTMRARSP